VLPFFDAPKPGGGPDVVLPIVAGAHKSDVESDQLLVFESAPNFVLLKFACCVVVDGFGLKLHVEDESISLGDVLAVLAEPKRSDSLAALIDNGLRATLPGVMDGSSSMFF
jgi:hypothetical protein